MRLDDLVEGPLHVQHHGVQFAARAAIHALDLARHVVQFLDAHRLREPARRIDGEDDDLPAALRRPYPQGRRRRGLADAAGAAAHHDPGGGVVQDRVHLQPVGVRQAVHEATPCFRSPRAMR